jgi:hypothetical protein
MVLRYYTEVKTAQLMVTASHLGGVVLSVLATGRKCRRFKPG